jgi:hypothetical protein
MGKLSSNEIAGGFTDELVIGYEDFSVANAGTIADDTDKTFTYVIPAGTQVVGCSAAVITAFNDSGGGDELDVLVGDGADPDGYLTILQLHTDGTVATYAYNSGALLDNENGKTYTVADTIDIVFSPNTSTGQSYSLNELTAGRIKFKFQLLDLN